MQPYFSVLIPVFNQVGLMDQCIESLKKQTFGDLEIIIVDDGSTDESLKMLERFAKEDSRIRILRHEKNKSLAAARYTAMKEAKGQYILFLDSDDYYFDYTCEKIHNYLMENPVDIVRFGYYGIRTDMTEEFPPVKTEDPYGALLNGEITPTVWKNCYSKSVIEKTLDRTESFYCNMGEDVFWGTVLYSIAESFGTLDEKLHNYLMGEGMSTNVTNQTIEKFKRNLASTTECGRQLVKYISKYDPENLDKVQTKIDTMQKYILLQAVVGKQSMCDVVTLISLFDNGVNPAVYQYGCYKLIPYVVRMAYGITDEMMDQLGIHFDKNIFS